MKAGMWRPGHESAAYPRRSRSPVPSSPRRADARYPLRAGQVLNQGRTYCGCPPGAGVLRGAALRIGMVPTSKSIAGATRRLMYADKTGPHVPLGSGGEM